jgi:hydroxymethylbilane synthase
LIIGTRGSDLALAQTRTVIELLKNKDENLEFAQKVITTSGDEEFARSPIIGTGKDAFTKEIDNALLGGEIDLAVHSLKDLPNQDVVKKSKRSTTIELAAFPCRESPFDVLVSKKGGQTIDSLPKGARIGTSSVRRNIQLKSYRPDFEVVEVHGNVPTRIKKLRNGDLNLDAIVLAEAGLNRLGINNEIDEVISPKVILPAVGQGCLAISVRSTDISTKRIVKLIDDFNTRQCVSAERRLSREFGGGCNVPVAALATLNRGIIKLEAMVARSTIEYSPNKNVGDLIVRQKISGSAKRPARLGKDLALRLKKSMRSRK